MNRYRHWIYSNLPPVMQPTVRGAYLAYLAFMDRFRLNDLEQIYTQDWYAEGRDKILDRDVEQFCRVLWERLEPESVADVGCGQGVYLECFQALGVKCMLGIEGTDNALKDAVVPFIVKHDLRVPFSHPQQYDLVLSIEVAEHIHGAHAGTLVTTIVDLCRPGGHIVLTAAPPGQEGNHHINLQPREYWIRKFSNRGCAYQEQLSMEISSGLDLQGLHWVKRNLMIFMRLAPT